MPSDIDRIEARLDLITDQLIKIWDIVIRIDQKVPVLGSYGTAEKKDE